jgi:hypothetical protein
MCSGVCPAWEEQVAIEAASKWDFKLAIWVASFIME